LARGVGFFGHGALFNSSGKKNARAVGGDAA